MKLNTPKTERLPNRDINKTYTKTQGAREMHDHFYHTDAQFVFKGVVRDGAVSDHRPISGDIVERDPELLVFD